MLAFHYFWGGESNPAVKNCLRKSFLSKTIKSRALIKHFGPFSPSPSDFMRGCGMWCRSVDDNLKFWMIQKKLKKPFLRITAPAYPQQSRRPPISLPLPTCITAPAHLQASLTIIYLALLG